MQEVLPQPLEAIKAYLEGHVQEATQEGFFPRGCEEEATCYQEAIL